MEEIGEEEEFSRQLTKVESVTTFPGNALVRELGDNAELWPPPLQLAGRGVTIPIRTHVSSFSQTCISCPATFLFESYLERNEEYRRMRAIFSSF